MTSSQLNQKAKIHPSVFLAEGSITLGDLEIGEESSIWFNTVIRADVNQIRIGKKTNIQDLSMVHVTSHNSPKPAPTFIGNEVTIGHKAIIHGCTIKDRVLIGMGAIVMDGALIEEEAMIGAGALVSPGTKIKSGMLALGSPAKEIRELKKEERLFLKESAIHYARLASDYIKLKT